jgi:hypothetical protein
MAKLTYEMNVDGCYDNYYVIKRDGVKFAHIFCLDEGKKKLWSVWIGREMVAKKNMFSEAWNWIKAREPVSVPDTV